MGQRHRSARPAGHDRPGRLHRHHGACTKAWCATSRAAPTSSRRWPRSGTSRRTALTYIFHLRPGVKFHDGSPLTAEAVAFSFDRSINKDNPLFKDAQGDYGGFPFIDDYIGNVVTKVEAVGAMDVKFTLKQQVLAAAVEPGDSAGFVMSMEALKKYGKGINENPVGTGPFKFVEWKKDDHITVDAFDGYWGDKPKLAAHRLPAGAGGVGSRAEDPERRGDVAWPIDPKDVPA